MSTELEKRLALVEEGLIQLSKDSLMERESLNQGFIGALKSQSDNYLEALKIQANSLSIPLLKDVLLPLMMKLFSFFSILVLLLLGGVLGIKWAFGDLTKAFGG